MNTKPRRILVVLFIVLSALATMGFSVSDGDLRAQSILADHLTCPAELTPSIYLSLLTPIEEHCFPDLTARLENEIDRGAFSSSSANIETLLETLYSRMRPTGSVEYLAILEGEALSEGSAYPWPVDLVELSQSEAAVVPSLPYPFPIDLVELSQSERSLASTASAQRITSERPLFASEWHLTATDLAEIEIDRGWTSRGANGDVLREFFERNRFTQPVDLLEESYTK